MQKQSLHFTTSPTRHVQRCKYAKSKISPPLRWEYLGIWHTGISKGTPLWHTILLAKSSVLYLPFRLARKWGWSHICNDGRYAISPFYESAVAHYFAAQKNNDATKKVRRYISPRVVSSTVSTAFASPASNARAPD